jgi:hypothetical protein
MSKYNKAIVSVVGALLTWYSTYAPKSYDHWLPLLLGVATALGVFGVKNSVTIPPAA